MDTHGPSFEARKSAHLRMTVEFVETKVFDGAGWNEVAMRLLRWIILTSATILVVAPATAQRYDPRYPVCLQKWGEAGAIGIDCSFTSLEQCKATASGLSASCFANPYSPQPQQAAPGRAGGRRAQ